MTEDQSQIRIYTSRGIVNRSDLTTPCFAYPMTIERVEESAGVFEVYLREKGPRYGMELTIQLQEETYRKFQQEVYAARGPSPDLVVSAYTSNRKIIEGLAKRTSFPPSGPFLNQKNTHIPPTNLNQNDGDHPNIGDDGRSRYSTLEERERSFSEMSLGDASYVTIRDDPSS